MALGREQGVNTDTTRDVVIIGAGMVGSVLAHALVRSEVSAGKRIVLIEASELRADAPPRQPGYDSRVTVLSAGSVACFRQLGLWGEALAASQPIHDIHVSDQGRFGSVRLGSGDEGVDALGCVVENAVLGQCLNRQLSHPALEICAPARVTALLPQPGGMRVVLEAAAEGATPRHFDAALVVLADGGRSGLASALGITQGGHDYAQSAIITNVSFSKPHQGLAFERFTPKGPLALLPLPDYDGEHRAALVWTHPRATANEVLALDDARFLAALQEDFGQRLGSFRRVGQRALHALSLRVAEEQIRPHLVLLGNVAHSLHPVAGQGYNLALRDLMLLARSILEAFAAGENPGSFTRLKSYLDAAGGDQLATIAFSDWMTRLFSSPSRSRALARGFAMAGLDLLPPLKHALSLQAMGMAAPAVRLP